MKFLLALALLLEGTYAFPSAMHHIVNREAGVDEFDNVFDERDESVAQPGCTVSKQCNQRYPIDESKIVKIPAGIAASQARDNCGVSSPCVTFNLKKQYVSTSGANKFISPGAKDIRGPCPGLNAAANHGYLDRSGVQDIDSTTEGLQNAYGMAPEFGAFLAVFSIALVGDFMSLTWSIGGPPPSLGLGGAKPQGISYSHSKYEGDTSIGRCDAYMNGGDAHSLSTARFANAIQSGLATDRYTFDTFAHEYAKNTIRSIEQNPYYFAPLVAVTVVSPAAYDFVIAFMSNHTSTEPGGYLNAAMLKSFFAITGDYPNYKWNPGQERIPDNWYRRPLLTPYNAQDLAADLVPNFAAYPQGFRLGGNVNGKNSYVGVDIANFTNGAFNGATILQGNNLACLLYRGLQQGTLDELKGGFNPVLETFALFSKYLEGANFATNCPQVSKFNTNNLNQYKGHNYSPKGAANHC